MTNPTTIANAALALLGEVAISSIDDASSAAAVICKQHFTPALRETLRLGRWNAATKRATLARTGSGPAGEGYRYLYALPEDCLRVMEVNGEQAGAASEYFEIEGRRIASNDTEVVLRYVSASTDLDPLMENAVALRLAHKIAIPLTDNAEKSTLMLQLFGKALAEARQVDAQESGSAENSGWRRIFSRSRLLNQRARLRNPLRLENF
jgi:hypothetical protein